MKSSVRIDDLAIEDWRAALRSAEDAIVYPLLVTEDGSNRVNVDPANWQTVVSSARTRAA
jgi:hypothetical protein